MQMQHANATCKCEKQACNVQMQHASAHYKRDVRMRDACATDDAQRERDANVKRATKRKLDNARLWQKAST